MYPGKSRLGTFTAKELADKCELKLEGISLLGWFAFQRRSTPNLESCFQPPSGLDIHTQS